MILERTESNNGYGCSCCRQDWEDSEWIDESEMMSFKAIIEEAYTNPLEGVVGRQYEVNGKILYGYRSDIFRAGSDVYIIDHDKELQITRICKPIISKEECFRKFSLKA